MGVQQLIANNTNVLIGSDVVASSVAPSTEISTTSMVRQGTGLVELQGQYTGHQSATYDVEIVSGEGNGRASTPVFSGVGSGSLSITAASIPAQEVAITLLTPPYPGAKAECLIGNDIVRAKAVGSPGNLINLSVNRSGLTFVASGSSTLEDVATGATELTGYKWDIPGVVCSTDLKGNVPADAPRLRFGTDPTIYRIVKDARSGSLKTIITPAAVRDIPVGSPIWLVAGTYAVSVTDGSSSEAYNGITTGYDLLSQLLGSSLVEPAYTPAPVTTPGGNAVTDLPLVTGSQALLTESSSAAVRPSNLAARPSALADTITLQSKGNGSWSVNGASGASYPDALEGQLYAPAASPVMLTIPAKPVPSQLSTPAVMLSGKQFQQADPAANVCVVGTLGINAVPKTITATYAKRPDPEDCSCTTIQDPWFNNSCLGLTLSNEEDIMSLDPAYQTRLISLYQWQKSFIESNSVPSGNVYADQYQAARSVSSSVGGASGWVTGIDMNGVYGPVVRGDAEELRAYLLSYASAVDAYIHPGIFAPDYSASQPVLGQLVAAHPTNEQAMVEYIIFKVRSSGDIKGYVLDANDVRMCQSVVGILASCLAQVWGDDAGSTAWDNWFLAVQSDFTALLTTGKLSVEAPAELLSRFQSGADLVYATAGIVPGKSESVSSVASTGCWQNIDAEYWWELSDGYAPAFTNEPYYSTQAVTFNNTKEFAFMIKCACADRLQPGDTLSIQIGGNLSAINWSSNEFLKISTIPTTPLYLVGGKDPDDTETWAVAARDNAGNGLPVFIADEANRLYSQSGLEFSLLSGGIPFSVGDVFKFSVEGGSFKWRKDYGDWSTQTEITDGLQLGSGLGLVFTSGDAPSFVSGDRYSFHVGQSNAARNILTADTTSWSWEDSASAATIVLNLPIASRVSHLALIHSLPDGTAIAVDYSTDGYTYNPLTWASGVVRNYLHVVSGSAVIASALRITIDQPGSIRWLWAGVPLQPELSAELRLIKKFDMARSKEAGFAAMLAQGTAASMVWDVIKEDDALDLAAMVDHVKASGDIPVILVPQHLHPEEAIAARVVDDALELVDLLAYQPDDTSKRIYSCTIELAPEWR